MNKNLLKGGIKEDEKEAFEFLCKNYGLKLTCVKAPGSHLNKLVALCDKIGLKIIIDFTVKKFAIEYDKGSTESPNKEENENEEEDLNEFLN